MAWIEVEIKWHYRLARFLQRSMDFQLSKHTQDMLKEREIHEEWMWRTINEPDWENIGDDNNTHYFKRIEECGGRVLHVVVNHHIKPKKVVTVFFDRKARRQT